ncbi:G-type lectin S-receptor serine/threonine-protein kinase [Spatholobus suberectus]|nr:G-type lectin S-receptor serine/threonine-protein kinase [Spatholobus suberectus]
MVLTSTLTSLTTLLCLCMFCVNATTHNEILQMGQSLRISDTILSRGGNFELGFFSTVRENSTKYYVGIRYKKVPNDKIVWVANRDYALETSSAVLTVQPDGNIAIIDGQVTYRVNKASTNFSTYVMLLDSGNLLLLRNSNQAILWQSFDNPTDTLLPGMTLGHDVSGYTWSLRSWTTADDPAPGAFSLEYDSGRASLIINNGSNVFWIDDHSNDTIANVISRSDVEYYNSYFTWRVGNDSRLVLEVFGELNQEYWSNEEKRWVTIRSSKCGTNNLCGGFSICNPQALHPCDCLPGFKPFDADSWRKGDTSTGCVRKTELSCSDRSSNSNKPDDGFLLFNEVQLPQTLNGYSKLKIDRARACESTCSRNCSCVAYSYDLNGTCQLWLDEVLSLKNISMYVEHVDNTNPVFYLKLAASELVLAGEDLLHFDVGMSMKAWDLWTNNSGMDLMDPALDDSDTTSGSKHTVPRYVNIGLLCVQESPADRPTMSDVVSMIGNDTVALPSPKPPAFLNVRGKENSILPSSMPESVSVNVITDSLVEAR